MDQELKQKIINLGELRYPPDKCANVLELSGEERLDFIRDIKTQGTNINCWYQIGIDLADFNIDSKLYQLAKTGDHKSIDMLEYRQKKYTKGGVS